MSARDGARRDGWTLVALIALTALTVGLAFLPLGRAAPYAAMSIATAKALLIALVFMHLARSEALVRVVACAGVLWMAVLIGFALSDYGARGPGDAPGPERRATPSDGR